MIEQRTFTIPDKADVHDVAEELDAAFSLGWRYVTALNWGAGLIVILAQLRPVDPLAPELTMANP
jgi:hypothetical protein